MTEGCEPVRFGRTESSAPTAPPFKGRLFGFLHRPKAPLEGSCHRGPHEACFMGRGGARRLASISACGNAKKSSCAPTTTEGCRTGSFVAGHMSPALPGVCGLERTDVRTGRFWADRVVRPYDVDTRPPFRFFAASGKRIAGGLYLLFPTKQVSWGPRLRRFMSF